MHPIFAPAELTPPDSEDLDHHGTRTSTYYLYVSADEDAHERDLEHKRRLLHKLGFAFFLFGLINNGDLLINSNFRDFLT